MASPSLYTFNHREVLELLVKAAGVHEGKWALQINFGFTAGNFQGEPGTASPGTMVVIQKFGIIRTEDPASPSNLTVDAAEINPKK